MGYANPRHLAQFDGKCRPGTPNNLSLKWMEMVKQPFSM